MKIMRAPKRSAKNHPVMAFDVETLGDDREFVCGTFRDDDGQHYTTVKDQLKEWLLAPENKGGIIYATNLFYDWTALFGGFPHPCKALFAGARLIRVHYPLPKGGTIRFYDTSNLTNRMSVAALGRMVGLEKLDTPSILVSNSEVRDRSKRGLRDWMGEIELYNRRDAEITYQWALKFQQVCNELGCEVKTTIASTALDLYKRRYMKRDYWMPPEWMNRYFREAYHGGLVFVFRKGRGKDVTYYDIRSLYPYVLSDRPYPDLSSLVWKKDGLSVNLIQDYEGFSRVRVRYPVCYFPILPVVINNYLTTCTGTYDGFWTHVELREAMKRGCEILEILETVYFTRTVTPLKGYMQDLYELRVGRRAEGDTFAAVLKLFMNALSGKWGQRMDNCLYEPVDIDSITDPRDLEGIVTLIAGSIEYYIKEKKSTYTPDFINVAWAAYMTAYARLYEIEYLEEAFPDVYACDTDSIFTRHTYDTGEDLGDMGVKCGPTDWVFLYPKQYASWDEDGRWSGKIKGVPRSGQEVYYRTGSYTWTKPATFKEAAREGVTPGDWIERTRTDREKYDKRVFLDSVDPFKDNTDSRPFTYEEAIAYFSEKPPATEYRLWGTIPKTQLPPTLEEQMKSVEIETEIAMLREGLTLPSTVIFALWDYKRSQLRRIRSRTGQLTTWDKAGADTRATELGFEDGQALVAAVEAQVRTYERIRTLTARL